MNPARSSNPAHSSDPAHSSPGRLRFLAAFAVIGLLTTIWSLASPLASVPDEPAHIIKAASVVRGQLQGESGSAQGERSRVLVPAFIGAMDGSQSCFAGRIETPAGCSADPGTDTAPTAAFTSAGNYNPMYYAVAGLPSLLLTGAPAIYAMRILSGLLSAAFIALSLISLAGLRRWRLPLVVGTFALTPMTLFLSGGVNPNSLEIASSLALFSCLCLAWDRIEAQGAWKVPLAGAAISAAVLANTRAASLLWLGLAVAASLLMFGIRPLASVARQRFVWVMAGGVAVACGLSVLWLQTANSLQNLVGRGNDATPLHIVSFMLDRTFEFAQGYVSHLGWLDTPGPSGVFAVWAALIVGTIIVALSVADRAGRLTVLFLAGAVVVLPPLLQIPLARNVGFIWQGRYILALVVVLMAACGVAMRSVSLGTGGGTARTGVARRASAVVLTAMVTGHLYSFGYGVRRYVIGIQDQSSWGAMIASPQWQPPFGWIALCVAYLAVLVAGALFLHRSIAAAPPTIDPATPAGRLRSHS